MSTAGALETLPSNDWRPRPSEFLGPGTPPNERAKGARTIGPALGSDAVRRASSVTPAVPSALASPKVPVEHRVRSLVEIFDRGG